MFVGTQSFYVPNQVILDLPAGNACLPKYGLCPVTAPHKEEEIVLPSHLTSLHILTAHLTAPRIPNGVRSSFF